MKLFQRAEQSKKNPGTVNARPIILPIVFCLVCGALLIFLKELALQITAYVLAGVMILWGVWQIISYIRSKPIVRITGSRLATGLVLLVGGALLAFNPDYLREFLPFIWGLSLLFGGFLKIQYAFDEKSVKVDKWWIMLILAAFSIAIGIISLLNPDFLGENRLLLIGIMLIVEAVIDIVVFFLLRHALRKNAEPVPAAPAADPRPEAAEAPASEAEEVHEPQAAEPAAAAGEEEENA